MQRVEVRIVVAEITLLCYTANVQYLHTFVVDGRLSARREVCRSSTSATLTVLGRVCQPQFHNRFP